MVVGGELGELNLEDLGQILCANLFVLQVTF